MTPAMYNGSSSSAPSAVTCGEDVCVTGVAGVYPDSDSVIHLAENLFNKVDLVSEDDRRWKHAHTEIPLRTGKINELKKFDSYFFDTKYKEAHTMDPMQRILMEKAYECILDAGMNPEELRNTKTGVFIGSLLSESEAKVIYEDMQNNENGLTGCQRFMLAHRISEWLNLKGPSQNVDTACSSSLFAFEHAFKSMQEGNCDAAFVCGSNLCLHPNTSLIFAKLGVLSYDGKCKSFDESANGYARSESIAVCLLQKAKDARRIYAKVVHAKTNCDGFKTQGINYPAARAQRKLFEDFYKECGVDPASVEFVEAHATGTNVGDPEEASAITDVFCQNRKGPLLIGSIKSNLGHGEGSSGLNSVTKGCIAYNTGYLPPNIHFETPRKEIPALFNGQWKVITEKTPWNRGYFALSSFGFGGANAHILMENISKPKINNGLPSDNLPRLVCISSQSEAGLAKALHDLESRTVDVDEVRLWHSIFKIPIKRCTFRGYVLLGSTPERSVALARACRYNNTSGVQACLKYCSLRSSWRSIAAQLMDITVFASSIQRCSSVLESQGLNLLHVINKSGIDDKYFIVGTVAVQIALTDLLTAIGIKPNYIIGDDIGVLCCAYADGSLTAEQALLAAYEVNKAVDNVFDSQPAKHFKQVKQLLNSKPNKELLKNLNEIIGEPRRRSERWLSKKRTAAGELVTAEHLIQCILSSSSSDQCAGAVIINVGDDEQGIPLVKGDTDNIQFLFTALGKLYLEGLDQDLAELYPTVPFPVALGTPMLSHLVGGWDHSDNWKVADAKADPLNRSITSESIVRIKLADDDKEFITGHVIDGRLLYPGTGYLILVWNTFSLLNKRIIGEMSVVFEDIYLMRATNFPKSGTVEFNIAIQMESGRFEITENKITVVTGRIYEAKKKDKQFRAIPDSKTKSTAKYENILSSKDFYKELNIRGYQYKGLFRGVQSCNVHGTDGGLYWKDNWVTFLDTMLQVQIVSNDSRSLYVPTRIEKVSIDTALHKEVIESQSSDNNVDTEVVIPFKAYPNVRVIRSGGAEIRGLHITAISKKPPLGIPVHEKNVFVPNNVEKMQVQDAVRTNIQIILENIQVYRCKVIELADELYSSNSLEPIIETVGTVLADLPLVQAELLVLSEASFEFESKVTVSNKKPSTESNAMLFIGANLLSRPDVLEEGAKTLKPKNYILSRETTRPTSTTACPDGYNIITVLGVGSEYLVLLREKIKPSNTKYIEISTTDKSYSWIEKVKAEINNGTSIGLYSQNEPINGLLGLVNCLRKEAGGENVCGILVADPTAPKFNPTLDFYKNQLDLGLGVNIYKNGQWGTYRHLLIENNQEEPVIHAYIKPTAYGDLSSLRFQEGPLCIDTEKQTDNKNIHVYCSALNFRDIMTAMGRVTVESVAQGRINQQCVQGIEMSGKLNDGTRVMAIGGKGITNLADSSEALVWPIPNEWSFTEAASVPVAYSTVYMAMVLMGKIKKGESILIHAGTGAVGQAAINVALAYGLEVFTTVGTPAKRAFIKRIYPEIDDDHIGNSRDISFEQLIRRVTNGKGVDLVLNSLADEKLQASVKCLKPGGRFLEIGKYDITTNTQIETCFLNKGISFFGVMLDFNDDAHDIRKKLIQMVEDGIKDGVVRPITYCTFKKNEVEKAFRYMAAGKHIGKVVIKIRDEEPDRTVVTKPTYYPIKAIPRYMCNAEYVYVFVGGLGGFGLELADWIVMRGGRKLVFSSRRGVSNGYQALRLKFWREYGAQIEVSTADVTTECGCEQLLSLAESMGPVRAIFNLAVILKDAVFANQTPDTFQTSFNPKAQATIHLDKLSRKLCPQLKDFVIFSSVSCGRGNAGQTNYGYSNSVMERICEQRQQEGLPALAIQWGAIGDVGLVADMQEENIQLEIGGTLQQRISSCLESLDVFLKQEAAVVSSIVVAEKRAGGGSSTSVIDVVANILGITDMKTISRQVPLSELGMDSVMAVEIKQTLERDFEIFLNAQEIRMLTFAKLIELSAPIEKAETPQNVENVSSDTDTDFSNIVYKNFGEESTVEEYYLSVPSLASTSQNNILAEEILLLLPGIEGCAEVLKVMCSKLKMKTIVMQLGSTATNMDDMVQRVYKIVKEKLVPGGTFHLLGYSYGAVLILAVAAKLEAEGYKGIVICIDGSPSFTGQLARESFEADDKKDVEANVIMNMFSMVSASIPGIMDMFYAAETFTDKVKLALELLPFKLKYSFEFTNVMALAIFTRVKVLLEYKETDIKKISSPIVLIRQKLISATMNCSECYGLEAITDNIVKVHYLNYNHKDIVDSVECADIVNETLQEFILARNKTTPNVPKERQAGTN